MVREGRKDKTKPHYISQSTLFPYLIYPYASSPPNKKTTLIYKTTPFFCHEW